MGVKRKVRVSADAQSMPVGQALEEFIEEKQALNKSEATVRNYLQSVRLFMEHHGLPGTTPLEEITQSHFFKWANSLKLDGVKPASINHYLRDCRVFFYWCMDAARGYISTPFKIQMIVGQEEQLKMFTDEEVDALLVKPAKPTKSNDNFTEWRNYAMTCFVVGTGSRCSTIVNVLIGDIDFNNREIVFRHTKNKKALRLPMVDGLASVLKEYIRYFRYDADNDEPLFPDIGGNPLTPNALRHSFTKYCDKRGVERHNIHGLRHTFSKRWIKNGGGEFRLQTMLGHSSLEMTRRYVKLFNEDLKEDFEQLNPLSTYKKDAARKKSIKANLD